MSDGRAGLPSRTRPAATHPRTRPPAAAAPAPPGPNDELGVMCATPSAPVRTRLPAPLRSGTIVAMETDHAQLIADG